ncbi:hypothetical protein [Streptomyces sp. NPDC048438]|uniref:hypothetical protein n=1 Tax=Streptomyces sp. NPDC048438 TaxID=3365551 RepID=UPI0037122419
MPDSAHALRSSLPAYEERVPAWRRGALTLTEIADEPLVLTRHLDLRAGARGVFRPLTHGGTERLACFLEGLSLNRAGSARSAVTASWLPGSCVTRSRYDKLRLALEEVPSSRVVGLLELGLALTPADTARAIRYYEKNGFRPVGSFAGADGSLSLDMMLDLRRRP